MSPSWHPDGMVQSLFQWLPPRDVAVIRTAWRSARARGISERCCGSWRRAASRARGVAQFLADPEEGLHDPRLLPDAEAALLRAAEARARGERVLVYGDFDADGLTGLSILVIALRRYGLDAAAYAPERLGDGHGLSLRAIERAEAEGRTLIVTADCGTSSGPEIEEAARRGIDVVVTDHHHAATWPSAAVAVVNPQRSRQRLSGPAADRRGSRLEVRPSPARARPAKPALRRPPGAGGSGDHRHGRGRRPDPGREPRNRSSRAGAAPPQPGPGLLALLARAGIAPEKGLARRHRVCHRSASERRRQGGRGGTSGAAAAGRGRCRGGRPGGRDRGGQHRAAGSDEELPGRGSAGTRAGFCPRRSLRRQGGEAGRRRNGATCRPSRTVSCPALLVGAIGPSASSA
jgi:hypothetical protein